MYYLLFDNSGVVRKEYKVGEFSESQQLPNGQKFLHWCIECMGPLPAHSHNEIETKTHPVTEETKIISSANYRQLPVQLDPEKLRRSAYRMTTDRMNAEKSAIEASEGIVPDDINASAISAKRAEIQAKYPDPEGEETTISLSDIN